MLLWQDGQAAQAKRLAQLALNGQFDVDSEVALRLSIVRLSSQFDVTEAVRQCTAALRLEGLSDAHRAELLSMLALNLVLSGKLAQAEEFIPAALEAADTTRDWASKATALVADSVISLYDDRWQDADDRMRLARRLAEQAGVLTTSWLPEATWSHFLARGFGRPDEASAEAAAGIAAARRSNQAAALRVWMMVHASSLLEEGRLEDAQNEVYSVLGMVDDLGVGDFADFTCLYNLGRVALHRGDERQLALSVADAERMMRSEVSLTRQAGAWLAALVADADGESQRALEVLGESIASFAEKGPSFPAPSDPAEEFTRIAMRAGRPDLAELAVTAAERRADLNPAFPILRAVALHARGLMESDVSRVRKAAEILTGFARPLALASALEDVGRMSVAHDAGEAIEYFDRALAIYEQTGAHRDASRVRRRLRGLGVRRARRAVAVTLSWPELTDAEAQVVNLAATGATNKDIAQRLFLSPHTIGTHLRHAYERLNITSRIELARLYTERLTGSA
ncbi:response regulator transcription factor [Dactylosporangium darangshiense]|uniref:response regulator transcription factor n=1 Tax=Dactylosporangium darangshiense TaxID=579108 RepID=UPI00363452E0